MGHSAKSGVDVCGVIEFDGAIDEADGGEYGKGIIMWKAKITPPLDYVKPGRDSTESRGWSHVGGAMNANEGLLLILHLIFLIMPLEIHLLDEIRMLKGIGQGVSTSALSKELQI